MPRERISISLGPLSSTVSAHLTSLTISSHSTRSEEEVSPFDSDAVFRAKESEEKYNSRAVPQFRGLLVDEKNGFLAFNEEDYDTQERQEPSSTSAWAGGVDVFGEYSDGSYGDFRRAMKQESSHRNFGFERERERKQQEEQARSHIPGSRTVDWDAYLSPQQPATSATVDPTPPPPPPGASELTRVLAECGGPQNISGWRDFYPPSLPLLHRLPVWSLRQSGHTAFNSDFGSEFINEVYDDLRVLLEECDGVQAFQYLVTHDPSIAYWSGLTVAIMEELKSECKSAANIAVLTMGRCKTEESFRSDDGDDQLDSAGRKGRQLFKETLNSALSLQGVNEAADLVVPVDMKSCEYLLSATGTEGGNFVSPNCQGNLFNSSAMAALAIESVFTPVSLKPVHTSGGVAVAGQGISSGSEMFAPSMAAHDLMQVLKPSASHKIAQVDGCFMNVGEIKQVVGWGHKERMEEDMRMFGGVSADKSKSVLSSMRNLSVGSERIDNVGDEFKVFATSTTCQYPSSSFNSEGTVTMRQDVLKSVYNSVKPDRMASCVVNYKESGSGYWPSVLREKGDVNISFVSTLSTSTRTAVWVKDVAENFNLALTGRLMDGARGYLSSEIASGSFGEMDDAKGVLEEMRRIGDLYEAE
jgi:hypothetical protein